MWITIISSISIALVILPFMPAIVEWLVKSDADTFFRDFPDNNVASYYKRWFESYIKENFKPIIDKQRHQKENLSGKIPNGEGYRIIVNQTEAEFKPGKSNNNVFIFCGSAKISQQANFKNKIYGDDEIHTGVKCKFNSIYAEKDLYLGEGSIINKFAYSAQSLYIARDCDLFYYAMSKSKIEFMGNAGFQYLSSPFIQFGRRDEAMTIPETSFNIYQPNIERLYSKKDLEVSENTEVSMHYIVKGNLNIDKGSCIDGNIKCFKKTTIKDNVVIRGAIVSESNIEIGDNCSIQGPIISYGAIAIGKNCIFGTQADRTSLIADNITIKEGTVVLGMILARKGGEYLSQTSS